MTDRPILFSAPMVRALLAGTKTQTRRPIARGNVEVLGSRWGAKSPWEGLRFAEATVRPHSACDLFVPFCHPDDFQTPSSECGVYRLSPVIEAGDRLWVRESLKRAPDLWVYSADGAEVGWPARQALAGKLLDYAPSIHMPKAASRLTLTVTDVRVQRLQDISEEDAIAEGVPDDLEGNVGDEIYCPRCQGMGVHAALGQNLGVTEVDCEDCATAVKRYRNLWDHINGEGAWAANPFVVAYTFDLARRNIDAEG